MNMLVSWAFGFMAFISGCVGGISTHYGTDYQGGSLSCDTGYYDTADTTIIAVGWESPWECGQELVIAGAAGVILATVQDRCDGCGPYHLDLSEAGQLAVCGELGVCDIAIYPVPHYPIGGHAPGGVSP